VKPFDREKSTPFFSCSSVRKIKIVVGCRRIHAGTQPLNINIGPSFFNEDLITPIVDWRENVSVTEMWIREYICTLEPGPDAFMIRLWASIAVRCTNGQTEAK